MASVECIQEAVPMLVATRQSLRERDAIRSERESNRLELAGRQQQLSPARSTVAFAALIARAKQKGRYPADD